MSVEIFSVELELSVTKQKIQNIQKKINFIQNRIDIIFKNSEPAKYYLLQSCLQVHLDNC